MQQVRRWYVVTEDKNSLQSTQAVDAHQLKFESGCAIFILNSVVVCAYAADVWVRITASIAAREV